LLANSLKDHPLSSSGSCSLYYFPEISGDEVKNNGKDACHGHFVSGALDRDAGGPPANDDAEDSARLQSMMKEAFEKGLEQGRAEIIAAQQEKFDQAAAALEAAETEMVRARQQDLARMETETVRLALAVAEKIIGDQAEQGKVIEHVVKAAMDKVSDPRHLSLRLNPKDIDAIHEVKEDLHLFDDAGTAFRLEADPSIQRGGCIIETKLGDVDARIDQQIRIVRELLLAELPKPAARD
jgi:flagellar biosynthesis/type III secretory pathway protein FliH